MKRVLIFLIVLFPIVGLCQTYSIDSLTHQVKYQKIFKSASSKDIIFEKANNWVASDFGSAKMSIDLSDKESGQLFIKGTFKVMSPRLSNGKVDSMYRFVTFDCRFYIKNKKYKVVVTKLTILGYILDEAGLSNDDKEFKYFCNGLLEKSDPVIKYLFSTIEKYIATKSEKATSF